MRLIADLHIHSRFSRATSEHMDLAHLSASAKTKGIGLLGTGDFTHPEYSRELKRNLEQLPNGLYQHLGILFMPTAEVACIYSKNGVKRIHLCICAPSLEAAGQINDLLAKKGNLASDGRPIFGASAPEITELVMSVDDNCFIYPAHAWTPWYSVFGSESGFDSMKECFEDQTKHIHALETGLSCYDPETEVLTADGWKRVGEATLRDEICTINPATSEVEFQRPEKVFHYHYKGKMYRLKTKRVDLLVTPNHNLFYSPCDFRNPKPYSLKEARQLFGKSKRFKKNGVWRGLKPEYFSLPAAEIKHGSRYYSGVRNKPEKRLPMRPWLKFFGFWLAEGWVSAGKDGDYNVCLSNTNPHLLNEMKSILDGFGYDAYVNGHTLRVRDSQLLQYLRQFGKAADKFIPHDIKSLSPELLEILFDSYIKGDGHRYGRSGKGLSATTISRRLRDDLQEIALKMGISAYYKLHNKKGRPMKSPGQNGKIYYQTADSWAIFFIRKNQPIVLPSSNKRYGHTEIWEEYDGDVFCVSVPNRVLYIRRNGIPLWCGNSDPPMNWRLSALDKYCLLSNSDSHSPQKIGREANVFEFNETEISYKSIIAAIKSKDKSHFKFTVEFFPEEGKYHWDGHRNCNIHVQPSEARKTNNICPACRKPLTIGVLHRVEELADRPEGSKPPSAIPFIHSIPLLEIIASALGVGESTKTAREEYEKIIARFGTEFDTLTSAKPDELHEAANEKVAEGILRVREGKVRLDPGYDGVYGRISIFGDEKKEDVSRSSGQKGLGDFF